MSRSKPRRHQVAMPALACLAALALTWTLPAPASAVPLSSCSANLAQSLRATGRATELVIVRTSDYPTTHATLSRWRKSNGCWIKVGTSWKARVGVNGVSDHHMEGDGTTPTGDYRIGSVMYGLAPNPGVTYEYHRLVCGDWWVEDPSSPWYNTFRHVACGTQPPFGGNSEALWRQTVAYQSFAVVEYNTNPVVAGRGSGVFLHDDVGGPTAGCVSLPATELDRALRWLQPGDRPLIVIGPGSEIRRF